jgi:phage-related minor tail protein
MKDGADAFQSAAAPALLDFETGAKKGSDAIKAFEQQFIKSLLSMANQALIFGPISRALQGVATGGISNLFGSAHGNVFSGGSIVPFAQGGVVDSPTIAPMALFGEAGPEAIMPLRRGADGNLGVAGAGGGGNTHITYQIDASGADSGTVEKIKAVLGQHARDIAKQAKATKSASRMQSSGVS